MKRRVLSVLLVLAICLPMLPLEALATEAAPAPQSIACIHHLQHTEDCGYIPASDGAPCGHVHTEDCYTRTENCTHVHDAECGYAPASEGTPCGHVHTQDCYERRENCRHTHTDDCYEVREKCAHKNHDEFCGYDPELGEDSCNHEHTADCYVRVENCHHTHTDDCYDLIENCTHVHDADCGYAPASEGTPCDHAHTDDCYELTENCIHTEHDEACGYAEPVEGHPCEFVCEICGAGEEEPAEEEPTEEEPDDDSWIYEKLRAIEDMYNSGIMLMSFVEGYIDWDEYFTVAGLPKTISEADWLTDCKAVSARGYNVDNTGVRPEKFPQYDEDGIHFSGVTVNGVEVVRVGILESDTGTGERHYYYLTQDHVNSDSNDGNGSHTGSISALLLPDDAKFQANYAVNVYAFTYEVRMKDSEVDIKDEAYKDTTWEQVIFNGTNSATTIDGAASFTVTIPYGYTAKVWMEREGIEGKTQLTGPRPASPEHEVNEGYDLGMEPEYTNVKDALHVPDTTKGPSMKRMSAVFFDDFVTENRKIVVELTKAEQDPFFNAYLWLQTANAGTRGGVAKNELVKGSKDYWPKLYDTKDGNGNSEPEDGYGWQNSIFKNKDPRELSNWSDGDKSTYSTHWYTKDEGETWNLVWAFQTNDSDQYILNSLELNGTYIDVPFEPKYIQNKNAEEQPNDKALNGECTTYATLADGAQVELTLYRKFNADQAKPQRIYILKITGAHSNVTITNGNLMQFNGGAEEYVATVLSGVTGNAAQDVDSFGYFSQAGTWEEQAKAQIQVQDAKSAPKEKTNFDGDIDRMGANLRFRLQTGYENPIFIWEDRVSGDDLEGTNQAGDGQKIISLPEGSEDNYWNYVKSNGYLGDDGKLKPHTIYGPVSEGDVEWYYIRISDANKPSSYNGHKMCVLTLTTSAMKYMVRYMVGDAKRDLTNGPKDEDVENMPDFGESNVWSDEIKDALSGKHPERYDNKQGNYYNRQTASIIPVSDTIPTVKEQVEKKKIFKYWVLVDGKENVIYEGGDDSEAAEDNDSEAVKIDDSGDVNKGTPIIIRPNETIDLSKYAKYGNPMSDEVGGTDYNYYVLRLKGVWEDAPEQFKFYIRLVWTDKKTGQSHIMNLVQNVTTNSTDPNMTEDGCLIVTINTVTDFFQDWFREHPFYAYNEKRDFTPTNGREENWLKWEAGMDAEDSKLMEKDGYAVDASGNHWEAYPSEFTQGSAENQIQNKDAYYRIETAGNAVRYIVQPGGTIVLHLDQVNGRLPISKTVFGSDPGADEFTYTITAKLLQSDMDRNNEDPNQSKNYLTRESLMFMLPSGTFFGMAPDETMPDLRDGYTGRDVTLQFDRSADLNDGSAMENWSSTATFTLKGGEATVLSVPQGEYTIVEAKGDETFAYHVTVNGAPSDDREAVQTVRVGDDTEVVDFVNGVCSVPGWPETETKISGENAPEATFAYELIPSGSNSQNVTFEQDDLTSTDITTENGERTGLKDIFGKVTFTHTGTYVFLVKETLKSVSEGELNTISPASQTKSVTVKVENYNGQLVITSITVDGTVYQGNAGDFALANAVVPFDHVYKPVQPDKLRVVPEVRKHLKGRDLLPAAFEFELTDADGQTYTATNNAAAGSSEGTVIFDSIDIDKTVGTEYKVTVREKTDPNKAFDYDPNTITITYRVVDDNGTPKVTAIYENGIDTFVNQAYADDGFGVKKNYYVYNRTGNDWDSDTFTMTAKLTSAAGKVENRTGASATEIKVGDTAEITLDRSMKISGGRFNFRFYNEGTYTFEVREKNGGLPGVSYDSSVYYVTVVVWANGEELDTNVSITKDGKAVDGSTATFSNTYNPSKIDVTVSAHKTLVDRKLTAGMFKFNLIPDEGTLGTVLTASNAADGSVTFTIKDMGVGNYFYTLKEVNDGKFGVTYDGTEYRVEISVVTGPTATVKYFKNGTELAAGDVPEFVNRSHGALVVGNRVAGNGANEALDFPFQFTFKDANGDALEGEFAYTIETESSEGADESAEDLIMPLFEPNSAALTGTIHSGQSLELRHGQTATIANLPLGTEFTVKETNDNGYEVSNDRGPDTYEVSGEIDRVEREVVNYINTLDLEGPEITVTKTQAVNGGEATSDPVAAFGGDTVTYYLTVKNTGDAEAALTLTDVIPEGLDADAISDSGVEKDGVITWKIPKLAANGGTAKVSFTVTLPELDEATTWTNQANASYTWLDGEGTAASGTVVINQAGGPKVSIVKTQAVNGGDATSDPVTAFGGDTITYYLTLNNTGATAADVTVTDALPEGLKAATISNNGVEKDGTITWEKVRVPANDTAAVSFTVKLPELADAATWTNQASAGYEWNGLQTIASGAVLINQAGGPKVSIAKTQAVNGGDATADQLEVIAGDEVTYYLTVQNSGATAADVTVTDAIPAGLKLKSISDSGAEKDGTITWKISQLAANGGMAKVSFTVTVPEVDETATWTNKASATYNWNGAKSVDSGTVVIRETYTPSSEPSTTEPSDNSSGTTETTESTQESTSTPKTGDESQLVLWEILLVLSLMGILMIALFIRKESRSAQGEDE